MYACMSKETSHWLYLNHNYNAANERNNICSQNMNTFLTGLLPEHQTEDESSPNLTLFPKQSASTAKTGAFGEARLVFGFTWTKEGSEERTQCVVCLTVKFLLLRVCSQPTYLVCHLDTKHPEHKAQPVDPFRQKLMNCRTRQSRCPKAASVPANSQLASYEELHSVTVEELILLCATDIVSCQHYVRFTEADGLSSRSLWTVALN